MPCKYVDVDASGVAVATFVHHRGPTTLPGTPPDTSKGRTVLCLHDAGGNGNVFAGLLDALSTDHSPIAFDLPGHGRSGGLDALGSIGAMAAHARGLADRLGLRAPVLVGDGMGAAIALEAAATDPAWPAAVVLVGGAAGTPDGLDAIVEQLRQVTAGRARREFDRSGYAPDTAREVYERAFAEWIKTDPRATLGDRTAQQAFAVTAAAVTCPVLVVVGEHEEQTSRAAAEALAAALPNATVITLAGAGRRGVNEQPDGLAAAITSFLQSTVGVTA